MECLFLSPTLQGGRVYLYAVPDGVPIYFKHIELMQQPGYRPLWRGSPYSIPEEAAARIVEQLAITPTAYRDYHCPAEALTGFGTARESFCSAAERLGQQLEYEPGTCPTEVLVGESPV
ncbi:MAG: hypothetical protein H7Z21_00475 [Hymenobacter sp.]|nr:hypothetical protein [Hymenobacter sp.]